MSDPFASGGSSGANITDFEGKLMLVYGTEYLSGDDAINTEYGEKDVVVADVIVFDDGGSVETEESGLYIFQGKLIGTLKRHVGKRPYLGRLGKGEASKKGYQKPWAFLDPTDADKAVARKFIEERAAQAEDPFAS